MFDELTRDELLDLLLAYDRYVVNDNEEWDKDRQPVCISEFYENEYSCETEDIMLEDLRLEQQEQM